MFDVLDGNVDNFLFVGYCCSYDASLDPYCIYLVDKLKKITWSTLFDFSFDFYMAFDLLQRVLTYLAMIMLVLSCSHACEPHFVEFDKLLQTLKASDMKNQLLKK